MLISPCIWAAQDAMVIVERAVVYSDKEMTSPVGFIRQGKKIKVGEIPRNRAQVYPIIVSGKVAYVRISDLTTEKESMDSTRLVAERFRESTVKEYKTKYVVSYFNYASTISVGETNGNITDGDVFNWNGLSFKGEVLLSKFWDFQLLLNYLETSKNDVTFRAVEFGGGGAFRLIDKRKFLLRLEGQFLAVPFTSYAVGEDFRVNGYGFSTGGGINGTFLFDQHWGMETYAGLFYTKSLGFDVPAPYKDVSPVFTGYRIGLGVNYSY